MIVLPLLNIIYCDGHVLAGDQTGYNFVEYRDQPWFSVFKHSMDHEEGV